MAKGCIHSALLSALCLLADALRRCEGSTEPDNYAMVVVDASDEGLPVLPYLALFAASHLSGQGRKARNAPTGVFLTT
jgi:hypothetical protein